MIGDAVQSYGIGATILILCCGIFGLAYKYPARITLVLSLCFGIVMMVFAIVKEYLLFSQIHSAYFNHGAFCPGLIFEGFSCLAQAVLVVPIIFFWQKQFTVMDHAINAIRSGEEEPMVMSNNEINALVKEAESVDGKIKTLQLAQVILTMIPFLGTLVLYVAAIATQQAQQDLHGAIGLYCIISAPVIFMQNLTFCCMPKLERTTRWGRLLYILTCHCLCCRNEFNEAIDSLKKTPMRLVNADIKIENVRGWSLTFFDETLKQLQAKTPRDCTIAYHYSSSSGMNAILKQGIKVSDTGYGGGGTSFSTLSPIDNFIRKMPGETKWESIFGEFMIFQLQKNYGTSTKGRMGNVDYVVAVEIPNDIRQNVVPDRKEGKSDAIVISDSVYKDFFPVHFIKRAYKLSLD